MLIFGLHSTSDDRLNTPSNESCPKCKEWLPNHQEMKCSLLHYVQLLMIGCAIQAIKVMQNVKINGKNFYGKTDLTKKFIPPPQERKKLEIWQKLFMADLA